MTDSVDPRGAAGFAAERAALVSDMGGASKVARLRAEGRFTARDAIDHLLDPGSFTEVGLFARSEVPGEWDTTPGDGKIGGHGALDGRGVSIVADDVTVKRASSSHVGARKIERIFEQAVRRGNPFVYVGETGGGRLPYMLSAAGFSGEPVFPFLAARQRSVPVACAIVGDSFGGSSFVGGLADFTVQVAGTCLAVTSPRVIEVATGHQPTNEQLGGTAIHDRLTGQIDLSVDSTAAALDAVRVFLSFLPSYAGGPLPFGDLDSPLGADASLDTVVPTERTRTYDMRDLLARVVDREEYFELKPQFAPSLITALARIGGVPSGIIANQPAYQVGSITPDACLKATRLLCLCDAFGLPVVLLQDTPGALVGTEVEHDRLIARLMTFLEALCLSRVPKISVVVRKAFGLAFFAMGGSGMGSDLLVSWPNAELGFMDPVVGANVLFADQLAGLSGEPLAAARDRLARDLGGEFDPRQVAGLMNLDDIIEPADTRRVVGEALRALVRRPLDRPSALAAWPHWS